MKSLLAARAVVHIGQKFHWLEVIGATFNIRRNDGQRSKQVVCQCKCGNYLITPISDLRCEKTRSCGCLRRSTGGGNKTHGLSKTPLYTVWAAIVSRCTNKNNRCYKNYGGRGIAMCDEWRYGPEVFCKWAIANGWEKGLEIDRIDNDGNYEPSNCRFVTSRINTLNRRNARLITVNGVTKHLCEWARQLGVRDNVILRRIDRGWPAERAVSEPI